MPIEYPTWRVLPDDSYTYTTTPYTYTTSGASTLNAYTWYSPITSTTTTGNWLITSGSIVNGSGENVLNDRWGPAPPITPRVLTPEDERRNQERKTRDQARILARSRAEELLLSLLSDPQRESYRLNGEFEVIGSAGGVYRIQRGHSGNVLWIAPDGTEGARLCAHPNMRESWLPDQDVALAQLLALVTDEAEWVRTANVHVGRRPTHLVAA